MPQNTGRVNRNTPPSTRERADALQLIKQFAREGYAQTMGAKGDFEELWRTAFDVEKPQPSHKQRE